MIVSSTNLVQLVGPSWMGSESHASLSPFQAGRVDTLLISWSSWRRFLLVYSHAERAMKCKHNEEYPMTEW